MANNLTHENLKQNWSLRFDETAFICTHPQSSWLDYAIKLRYYAAFGSFPTHGEVPIDAIEYVASQLGTNVDSSWTSPRERTERRRKEAIRLHLGIRTWTLDDAKRLRVWISENYGGSQIGIGVVRAAALKWCLDRSVSPPANEQFLRMLHSVRSGYDRAVLEQVHTSLSDTSKRRLDASLQGHQGYLAFAQMKTHPGRVSRATFMQTVRQLEFVVDAELEDIDLNGANDEWIHTIKRRVQKEDAYEIRRHEVEQSLAMYAVYLAGRKGELIDLLLDLLIETIQKIRKHAEKQISKTAGRRVERSYDERALLKTIIELALKYPEGTFKEHLYPMVSPSKMEAMLARNLPKQDYANDVFEIMRSSWQRHYRIILSPILGLIEFKSNNRIFGPLLTAVDWLKNNSSSYIRKIPSDTVPIEGVIAPKWKTAVIDEDGTINRISYELCVLMTLRNQLRCKEVWVPDAVKFRNPDEDLPPDFEETRDERYNALGLSLSGKEFCQALKEELTRELRALNDNIIDDPLVRILWTKNPRISITPLTPQAEPKNLSLIKNVVTERHDMTSLLDMVKETALETGFLDAFKSSATRTVISREDLDRRLLYCIYGLGTNAGLARMSAAVDEASYKELIRVRRLYLEPESIRKAIRIIVNKTLEVRDPKIWGPPGSACASDSKQFGAWDQNPLAEWHMRYGGRGVMVYWHVEKKSLCIYSQMKRVSSNEAASMIEGVLRHCSDAEVVRQYVDSHGQTEVAFAFCRLLGFELAPRIKAITKQKLYLPSTNLRTDLDNIGPLLAKNSINFDDIKTSYDEMVKYTSAMKGGYSDPESILRRFKSNGVMHPTYKGLVELGRAVKTIFLCKYFRFEKLRREIHEGLNVVENWNSATGFVHFGRGGEISTNRREDQEIAALTLHLVQNCMVFVNTVIYQSILSEPRYFDLMEQEDFRGITPLIYKHVTPYGHFKIDLENRMSVFQ